MAIATGDDDGRRQRAMAMAIATGDDDGRRQQAMAMAMATGNGDADREWWRAMTTGDDNGQWRQAMTIPQPMATPPPRVMTNTPTESFPGGWWNEVIEKFPWLEAHPWPSKPAQTLITCMKTKSNDVIRQLLDTGGFPNFFENILFSDIAKLARTWEDDRQNYGREVEALAAELESRKDAYARENAELPGRIARIEHIFLRAWQLNDAHIRNPVPTEIGTPPPPPPLEPAARAARCQALDVNDDELDEMEQAIATISANARALQHRPTPRRRQPQLIASNRQFTAFATIASHQWIEHTCQAFRHSVWRMDTYNHLAPISIKAYQFLAALSDDDVKKSRAIAYKGQLNYCGRGNPPFKPTDLPFPLMTYVEPDKCGESEPTMWHKKICQPPSLDLRNLHKVWSAGRPYLGCSLAVSVHEVMQLSERRKKVVKRLALAKAKSKMRKYWTRHRHIAAEPIDQTFIKKEIEFLTRRFLVLATDKAASTSSFVYMNFIRQLALARLSSPDFVQMHVEPELLIEGMHTETEHLLALPHTGATLPYLMAVFKAHKGTFRWITNTANSAVSSMAELCACLLSFLVPSVREFCEEEGCLMEAEFGVRPNLWWPTSSVGEFAASLPPMISSVYSADITCCFELIPTDASEHSLIVVVKFFVECAMKHRRDRSPRDAIRVHVTESGWMIAAWSDRHLCPTDAAMHFTELQVIWVTEWCLSHSLVQLGGQVWRQVLGIPMGLACSPIWFDVYFFKYEYQAMRRMLRSGLHELVASFRYTFRLLVYCRRNNNTVTLLLHILLLLFRSTSGTLLDTATGANNDRHLQLVPRNQSEQLGNQASGLLNRTTDHQGLSLNYNGSLLQYLGNVLENRPDRSSLTQPSMIYAIAVSSDGKSVYYSENINLKDNRDGLVRGCVVRKAQWTDTGNGGAYIISDVAGPWVKDLYYRNENPSTANIGTDVSSLLLLSDQELLVSRKYNNRLSKFNVSSRTEVDYWNMTLPLGIVKPLSGEFFYVSTQDRINRVDTTLLSNWSNAIQTIAGPSTSGPPMPATFDATVGPNARFRDPTMAPQSITRDGEYLYVLEYWSKSVREVHTPTGATRTIGGGSNVTLEFGIPAVFNDSSACIVTKDGCNLFVAGNGRLYWAPLVSVGGDIREINIVAELERHQGERVGNLMDLFLFDDRNHLFVGSRDGRIFQFHLNATALHNCSGLQATQRNNKNNHLILIVGLCVGFAVLGLCGGGLALGMVTVSRRRRLQRSAMASTSKNYDKASFVVPEEKIEVAIKVMAGELSEIKLGQFRAEAMTLGGVQSYLHPEHPQTRDRLFRTSEESFVDGKLPLRWTEMMSIGKQIAACLRYLHQDTERPIVHRDVKSSNVLIQGRGKKLRAYLSDFGLAKPGRAHRDEGDVMTGHTTLPTQTRAGTPGCMPPEVRQSEAKAQSSRYLKSSQRSPGRLLICEKVEGLALLAACATSQVRLRARKPVGWRQVEEDG
ncbi:hypothetical protein CBR_g40067 [Chara braunii]|uniref:Protein kinase domain-containing protein n=1 Tax=Chara braunii TaxID=69332 RepID=A0A388LT33_CHABU|nr:hypothetical protein CBR_g40067 [Chara braunii]|eukprot:GBG85425.1 hypothetical protein CBR_g40067 [Chara braunii]